MKFKNFYLGFCFSILLGCIVYCIPLVAAQNNLHHHSKKKKKEKKKSPIITNGPRDKKMIALTFDADMNYAMKGELKKGNISSFYNKEVIAILIKYKIKATLFLTGMWVEEYPNVAKELANNPLFEIENHLYSHLAFIKHGCYGLGGIAKSEMSNDLKKSQESIIKFTGKKPTYFRFPGGCYDDYSLKAVNDFGLTPVQWDVSSGDAYLKDANKIASQTKRRIKNGSIVVMHMNGGPHCPATAEALKILLPQLINEHYQFVTLNELLKQK